MVVMKRVQMLIFFVNTVLRSDFCVFLVYVGVLESCLY